MMDKQVSREEHLSWCKQRAQACINTGDLQEAFSLFASDVSKHPETADIQGVIANLGMPLLMAGLLATKREMQEHIQGYN